MLGVIVASGTGLAGVLENPKPGVFAENVVGLGGNSNNVAML